MSIGAESEARPAKRRITSNEGGAWWKSSVVYQIYPRSFCDSNGDGVGDVPGITSKLDYLKELGVDVIWLSPIFQSPNDDNGYDISDYRDIMPEFGTMADFDVMLAGMHARGLKLVMDLVVNHCSDEHRWFVEGRKSRDNPFHDYFIWRDPVQRGEASHNKEPNNWEACFGGSVWEWNEATGEYFLHMFSRKQPDLNWENPALRAEVYSMMRFWLDKGVDGFRMDVINMISKTYAADGRLLDAKVVNEGFLQPGFDLSCNGPRLMEFLREMRRDVLDHFDIITVGECCCINSAQAREITDASTGALNMVFHFEHMDVDSVPNDPNGKWAIRGMPLPELKRILSHWQKELHTSGWNSLYWSNHDQPRPVSRFGDDKTRRLESAKMLATCLHFMQGTPYVYQGEELGMTNALFSCIDECRDLEILNFYKVATTERGWSHERAMASINAKGRDQARMPMQWDRTPNAGFTTGTPWIGTNPNYTAINAEAAVGDPDSIFHYYRRLIAMRKQHPIMVSGKYELLLADHLEIFAYTRTSATECFLIVCNFSSKTTPWTVPAEFAGAECLLSNYPTATDGELRSGLRPYEAQVMRAPKA